MTQTLIWNQNALYMNVASCIFDSRAKQQFLTLWRRIIFLILAHPVYKMLIIQEPNKLALWNKLYFEDRKNGEYRACLKYSVPIFVE